MTVPEHAGRVAVHEGSCSPVTGCFRETDRVDPKVERTARATLADVSATLGVDSPELVFMVQTAWHWSYRSVDDVADFYHQGTRGFAERDEGRVWVSVALSVDEVAEVVAHEVAHMAGADELAAREYAAAFIAGDLRAAIPNGVWA